MNCNKLKKWRMIYRGFNAMYDELNVNYAMKIEKEECKRIKEEYYVM
jgi:uncharacterized protein with NRDE domain